MEELGLAFLDSEQAYTGELGGIAFSGRYDLMLGRQGEPAVLVDMKWSSQKKYEKQVTSGTATQLAAYHYLLGHGRRAAGKEGDDASAAPSPVKLEDAWFFLLPKSAIHAVSEGSEGKTLEEHWNEVEQAWKAMRVDLEHGILRTAAEPKAGEKPCRYCGYKKLCGMTGTANDGQD